MFDIDYWYGRQIYIYGGFKVLGRVINGDDIMALTKVGIKENIKFYSEEDSSDESDDLRKTILLDALVDDMEQAYKHYANMMIVSYSTFIECILYDFLVSFFIKKPVSMYEYLVDSQVDSRKGYISLNEIIKQESIEALIVELAKKAAKRANSGDFIGVIKRIVKLTKVKCNTKISGDIDKLLKTRNSIVHDAGSFNIEEQEITKHFESVEGLLKYLGYCCQKDDIPYNNTCQLISDYR